MKAHILIVEDEAILYERLRRNLIQENYSVDKYTPSVEEAIGNIHTKRPDLVLLDIDLQGGATGLDLGKRLYEEYKIPFIYVTQYNDDETFYKGLHTRHEDFIVKTKPTLDFKELLRKIQTVLSKQQENNNYEYKQGIMGLTKYLDEIKMHGGEVITRVPVPFDKIVRFSVNRTEAAENGFEGLRTNYVVFYTEGQECFLLKASLSDLSKRLPHHFVRINDKYIVNLLPSFFDGRINGSKLSIAQKEFTVTSTYKDEVRKRIELLYGE